MTGPINYEGLGKERMKRRIIRNYKTDKDLESDKYTTESNPSQLSYIDVKQN